MAAYVDQALLVKMFGEAELIQLTDRTETGSIDTTVLGQAITQACNEADSYIGAAYELPLASTPPALIGFVADIARYYLYAGDATEHVTTRYNRAIEWLVALSKGIVKLGLAKTDTQPVTTVAVVAPSLKVFTDDFLGLRPGPTMPNASNTGWPWTL